MSLLDTASLIVTPNGYKEGKLYSVIPSDGSGDLSVTRATTATRVNSAGLVELVPYNLLSYSEDFSNSIWNKTALSISTNSTTAPNGSTTADTITNSSSSGIILQTYSSVNTSQIVTHSVYLKRTNNDWAVLAIARSGATTYGEMYVWFNLSTGVVGGNLPDGSAVILDTEIENVGNGWYRCSVTGYVPNAVAYTAFMLYPDGNNSFTRVTGQSVYAWGAQLVEGSTAKDYQKTETRLNIPRLDYSNGTCPSLLVEPQRTNLFTYSQQFDNANWGKTNVTITANSVASPSGLQNAYTITPNTTNGVHRIEQDKATSGQVFTQSVYAKANGYNFIALENGGEIAYFNINTGTIGTVSGGSASIQNFGNGWYKCIFTATALNSKSYINVAQIDNQFTFAANGTSGIYLWGAQFEAGAYGTSYIPTTSASVTRNADVISKTGISSLIGQTEGTIFCELDRINGAENMGIWMRTGITSYNEMITILINPDGTSVASVRSSATQQYYASSTALSSGKHKFALAYKANDFAFYIDGVQISTSTSGTPPTCDQVYLGGYPDGGVRASKNVATALWQTRLDNATLATLTTL